MGWIYERAFIDAVDRFARNVIPDPAGWHDARCGIQQVAKIDDRAWNVEVDIPCVRRGRLAEPRHRSL